MPLSLAALVGCGGSNHPVPVNPVPAPSSEAALVGLSISGGELSPAFNPNIGKYSATVGYSGESYVGVTATTKNPKARLTVNGVASASGSRADVAINEGANTIYVVVVAEDGLHSESFTLTVNKLPFNTSVWVVNGIGGVPLDNTLLTLTDARGKVLADNVPLPRAKNGQKVFGLDPKEKYSIYAKGDGAARACFANFDPSKEDTAEMICLRTYSTYYQYEAPVIEKIEFAATNSDGGGEGGWKTMPNEAHYVGTLADVAAVKVTTLTRNQTAGTGPDALSGCRVCVDYPGTFNTAAGSTFSVAGAPIAVNVPVTLGGVQWYRNTYRAALPQISASVASKEHYLSIVAMDMIGNRTEQRVYLTITDSTNAVAGDPDISGIVPTWSTIQAATRLTIGDYATRPGVEADSEPVKPGIVVNAMDPVDPYTGYQAVSLTFFLRAAGSSTDLGYRGWEIWRSIGENNWVKAITLNWATLTTTAPSYSDYSPALVADKDVYYRVRAFNGNPVNDGYSQYSAAIKTRPMPPSTTELSPSFGLVSTKLWPTFRFRPTNPLMADKDVTDTMEITLYVKNVQDPYPVMLCPMQVRFTECDALAGFDADAPEQTHRFGFKAGKPTAWMQQVTGYNASTGAVSGAWHRAFDTGTANGETTYTPFAYLDDAGNIVINTDSPRFQELMDNQVRAYWSISDAFLPGVTYHWGIFGRSGGVIWNTSVGYPSKIADSATNGALFTKGMNANGTTFLAVSYGSSNNFGYGPVEGLFDIIIDPSAK